MPYGPNDATGVVTGLGGGTHTVVVRNIYREVLDALDVDTSPRSAP